MQKSNTSHIARAVKNVFSDLQVHYRLLLKGAHSLKDLKKILKETKQLETQVSLVVH